MSTQNFLDFLHSAGAGATPAAQPGGAAPTTLGEIVAQAAGQAKVPTGFDDWLATFNAIQANVGKDAHVSKGAHGDLTSGAVYLGNFGVPTSGHIGSTQHRLPDGTEEKSPTLPTPAHKVNKLTSVTDALGIPAGWDHNEQLAAMQKMRDAGFTVNNYDDMMKVWQAAVQRSSAALTASNGKNKLTPWDALALYGEENKAVGNPNTPGSAHFTGATTTTSRSINELTEGQTWAALRGTLQQLLGRDPSDQEVRNFTYKMNALAAANPSLTKSTTQYQDGRAVSQSSTQSGGITSDDAAQAAYDQAQQNPEYGAYQAATTYYNAALSALGAVGNVGTL